MLTRRIHIFIRSPENRNHSRETGKREIMRKTNLITPKMSSEDILGILRETPGYFLTNNERDVSQSDFKNRILPQTTLKVAPYRDETGYFAFEISGGASIHVDILKKQIDPFEKLRLVRRAMPNTLLQTVCRGANLFGYRHYPENVIRFTVQQFAKYIDVWRVYDFLNHVPNMIPVFEEVKNAGKILMPCICFSTGPEHTDEFYVNKVKEILDVTGTDIILGIKNHSGLGSPRRIGQLVHAIKKAHPDLIIQYHGHNTDGNDISRMCEAVMAGAKICEVSDHGFGGVYSQAPALTLIQVLNDYGHKAAGIKIQPLLDCSDTLRRERRYYEQFESPFKGFDPTVRRHKMTGGAAGSSFEQAEKIGLLDRFHKIFDEIAKVLKELGNFWATTPGSQILWTTAVSNVLHGRYERPSDDLKNLILGRYGPFPFYDPQEWICEKVLEHQRTDKKKWHDIIATEGGLRPPKDVDIEARRKQFEKVLGEPVDDEKLCLYLQYPYDTLSYFRFAKEYGKTWLLPPDVWFRKGGFKEGECISFQDYDGKTHKIEVISTRREGNRVMTSLLVDHNFQTFTTELREDLM